MVKTEVGDWSGGDKEPTKKTLEILKSSKPYDRMSANDFNYWKEVFRHLEVFGHYKSVNEMVRKAQEIEGHIRRWVEGYEVNQLYQGEGFARFKRHWRSVRMFIPLQVRLCAEQVFYDKGYPWNSLVSGFNPYK